MQAITKFYGKRKRASDIVKKYSKKPRITKSVPYVPKSWFEKKTHIVGAALAPSVTGSVVSLVDIVGGSGRDQRTGNRVSFNGIEIRVQAKVNHAGPFDQLARFVIVQDLQTVNSTIPSANQIIESNYLSGESLNNRGRFKVLFDKSFQLSRITQSSEFLYYNLPISVTTEWVANTGPQHSKNGIFCVFMGDVASGATLDYNFRMNYMDW